MGLEQEYLAEEPKPEDRITQGNPSNLLRAQRRNRHMTVCLRPIGRRAMAQHVVRPAGKQKSASPPPAKLHAGVPTAGLSPGHPADISRCLITFQGVCVFRSLLKIQWIS